MFRREGSTSVLALMKISVLVLMEWTRSSMLVEIHRFESSNRRHLSLSRPQTLQAIEPGKVTEVIHVHSRDRS